MSKLRITENTPKEARSTYINLSSSDNLFKLFNNR